MASYCPLCNKKISFFKGPVASELHCIEGTICGDCYCEKILQGLDDIYYEWDIEDLRKISDMHVGDCLKFAEEKVNRAIKEKLKNFSCTYKVYKPVQFDDNNRLLRIEDIGSRAITSPFVEHARVEIKKYTVYEYSQIVAYEVLEDGNSISSGGVTRAIVGGLVAGGVGAIVGATTRSFNSACTSLEIKLAIKGEDVPIGQIIFLTLINRPIQKNSAQYREIIAGKDKLLAKFKEIVESNTNLSEIEKEEKNPVVQTDTAEEIRKYKALLDDGIITQEEFERKKQDLLFGN